MRVLLTLLRRSAVQSARVVIVILVLLVGFQLVLVVQAASYQQSQSFGRLAELMPGYLQRGLGNMTLLLASFQGMVTLGYFHPIIVMLMAILAAYITSEPAYEVETGLVDVVLARPLQRHLLVTRSLVLAAACVAAAGLAMALGTWAGLRLFAERTWDWPSAGILFQLVAHLVAAGWCFGAAGLAVAAGARRRSTPFALVSVAAAFLYLTDLVAMSWAPARLLARLSPFHYYPAVSILAGTAPRWSNLAILLSATAVFAAIGYWRFARRDL
jgi:ABC-type transport system involved in multi-copper enzyme maturation permease subunit